MKIEQLERWSSVAKNLGFNPYSNGMKIERDKVTRNEDGVLVLILILME